ncbi:DNA adenine methylase [Aeribacillus composti]|uniref:DNA adenine methylase n=1 Tax=Aeribacillus composti TaxID=1868734 RepID=UPI00406A9551
MAVMGVIIIPVTDSPLRYPGGKTQLKGFINELIQTNSIKDCIYVEPFAGGAGVAMSLLLSEKVQEVIINDIDLSIYCFWKSILEHTDDFIKLLEETPVNLNEWYKQKHIQENKDKFNVLEIGFSTFFLNRTNRSGIITGGPIGGYSQQGQYKIDCRFNKKNLIKKILRIASYKKRITITNYDASVFIDKVIKFLDKDKTFIFFDPPYYEQGKHLYTNFYTHDDHVHLSKKILSLKDYYWITTYDLSKEIMEIYNIKNQKIYRLNYSANNKRKAAELLFYSKRITLPKTNHIELISNILPSEIS